VLDRKRRKAALLTVGSATSSAGSSSNHYRPPVAGSANSSSAGASCSGASSSSTSINSAVQSKNALPAPSVDDMEVTVYPSFPHTLRVTPPSAALAALQHHRARPGVVPVEQLGVPSALWTVSEFVRDFVLKAESKGRGVLCSKPGGFVRGELIVSRQVPMFCAVCLVVAYGSGAFGIWSCHILHRLHLQGRYLGEVHSPASWLKVEAQRKKDQQDVMFYNMVC